MKKFKKLLLLPALAAVALSAGCSTPEVVPEVRFEFSEYVVKSGEAVTADYASSYKLLGDVPDGVSVGEDGTFVISSGVADGTQVVLAAVKDGKVVATAVCKLSVDITPPQITFGGQSNYILNGDRVRATSGYGITYSLKTPVDGIKINSSSGRVSFTQIVEDGTPFTVVASSRGATAEKQYLAAVGELVSLENTTELVEHEVGRDVRFVVDYGDMSGSGAVFAAQGIIGVNVAGRDLAENVDYTYDKDTRTLTVKQSVAAELSMGENEVSVYTAKNAAVGYINAAKYIRTAEDLAAINDSKEALAGYYALVNDIDLGDYLHIPTEGEEQVGAEKNPGGWQPIGQYKDVTDGSATAMAFRGTFDGLGHKISGLWIDWTADRDLMWETDENGEYKLDGNGEKIPLWQTDADGNIMLDENQNKIQQKAPKAQYFNAGLFGYVTGDSVIRNLEVETAEGEKNYMCSYSGGIVGVNCGLIENCLLRVNVALEPEHRVAGTLAGRNEGTVRNCISLGSLLAGSRYGALVGTNQGKIIDCYALDPVVFEELSERDQANYKGRPDLLPLCGEVTGSGSASENCAVYKTLNELLAGGDFSAYDGWVVTAGELPSLIKTDAR